MGKILLIDDDDAFNFLNKVIIENAGFSGEIESCSSAMSAIHVLNSGTFKRGKPNLIFLDIQMPVMDGFEFLDEFNKMPSSVIDGIKIAMLTSSISEKDKSRSLQYKNVIDFIHKPLSEDKVRELGFCYTQ